MNFSDPAKRFAAARRSLMQPYFRSEAHSIADALHECSLGLENIDYKDLDGGAQSSLRKLRELMDAPNLEEPSGCGVWLDKAASLTFEQKCELLRAVDDLATWFDLQTRSASL